MKTSEEKREKDWRLFAEIFHLQTFGSLNHRERIIVDRLIEHGYMRQHGDGVIEATGHKGGEAAI